MISSSSESMSTSPVVILVAARALVGIAESLTETFSALEFSPPALASSPLATRTLSFV